MSRIPAPTTLKDVAREAGVTAMTVSAVLHGGRSGTRVSDATRVRIEEVAARMQYRRNAVARGLSRRRMDTLGVAAEIGGGDVNLYFLEILEGILETAALHGQSTSVFPVTEWQRDEQRLLALCDGRVDGVICISPRLTPAFGMVLSRSVPLVTIHAAEPVPGVHNVDIDNEGGAYTLVRYLAAQGHRRIAHFTGELDLEGGRQRLAGYRRALMDSGIAADEALVLAGTYTAASGAECLREMLDRPGVRPTAVFCANDGMAHGVLEAMASRGLRAPEDLSIGGFDDLMLARMTSPQLTTVRQPFREMAARSVDLLLAQIGPGASEASVAPNEAVSSSEADDVFSAKLVVRQSVGPAPR